MLTALLLFSCASDYEATFTVSGYKTSPTTVESSEVSVDTSEDLIDSGDSGVTDTASDPVDSGDTANPETICGDRETGVEVGLCAQDFSLPNATETMVSLHDFYGQVIFLDFSSFT